MNRSTPSSALLTDGGRADRTGRPASTSRNPWATTFLSPVPIAFAVGITATALLGLLGVPALASWPAWLTGGLVLMFLMGAMGRLVPAVRAELIAMVPPRLPHPGLIVAATGVLETAGAIGLLIPATHDLAALCLTLLLVAVFPANVHAARTDHTASPLLPRTIEQILFVGACLAVAFS
ncbi:DoxX family protein [Agromyces sp. NPDC058064]|uniref:DoxX family protein n=1 Tax=Agromyces sp. NPDC058064 TaxID=3346322 RepID=UPI0036DC75E5